MIILDKFTRVQEKCTIEQICWDRRLSKRCQNADLNVNECVEYYVQFNVLILIEKRSVRVSVQAVVSAVLIGSLSLHIT